MNIDRRHFVKTVGMALAPLGVLRSAPFGVPGYSLQEDIPDLKIGICDWNLGPVSDPEMIPKAEKAHLEGIQVSIGDRPNHLPLRKQSVRKTYLEFGRKHNISFPSVAAGSILNRIPLKSEPQSAIFVLDAIEAADSLGANNILLAFFGAGDLRLRDDQGNLIEVGQGAHNTYKLDTKGVQRVVEVLRQIVPRAEEAGVVIGLENTLTAEQNLDLIDAVGSDLVQVYYDVGNSTAYGYDVPGEIRRLGSDRICEIHLKETLSLDGPTSRVLGAPKQGGVDFGAVVQACSDIEYNGWFVLETGGREGRFLEDTRTNVSFVRQHFL